VLELLAIDEPAPDGERRGVVTADQAILRQGRNTLRRLRDGAADRTHAADKATATATPVINCLTVLRMSVSHPSWRDRRSQSWWHL
jgi:hypothetical protein